MGQFQKSLCLKYAERIEQKKGMKNRIFYVKNKAYLLTEQLMKLEN